MIIYKILFKNKKDNWDICIKCDINSYKCEFYFRRYNTEFDSVCEFRRI